ncbi:MAG: beta strand repeat-containing protein [Beijerinckiaceae bacterium]
MATYTKLVTTVAGYSFTASITASTATSVTIALTDGTTMVLGGTGFVVSGGAMTAGSITSMTHKNAGGTNIETWTGIPSFSATGFQSQLTPTVNTDAIFAGILNSGDNLRGNSAADILLGYAGGDFIRGLAGNDTIDGGAGEDMASYDNDSASGGGAAVVVNLSANAVNVGGVVAAGTARDGFGNTDTLISIENARGTAFGDTFIGGTGLSFFEGLAGADTYITNVVQYADNYYSNGFGWVNYQGDGGTLGITANLQSGAGTDSFGAVESYTNITAIRGTLLADNVTGNQYYNFFQGLQGADTFNGGGGYDRVGYERDAGAGGTAGVTVNLTTGAATDGFGNADVLSNVEQVIATNANDQIIGNNWDNFLAGLNGNDNLAGGDGFDTFRPGLGTDTVDGSVGTNVDQGYDDRDQLDYSDTNADGNGLGVIINLSGSSITHESFTVLSNTARDTGGSTDTLIDIERLRGTNGRDYFRGSDTANLREEIFRGIGGNDVINGGAGYNIVRYQGDTADFGGTGLGGTSGVIVNLSAGSITVGAHTVLSGTARDAFGATDTLTNIQGVRGTGLNDYVVGDAGYNTFRIFGGSDFFDGGAGNDVLDLFMDDVFFGISGTGYTVDMTTGTAVNFYDNLTSYFTNVEEINGSERNDTLTGNSSSNNLFGSLGNDSINAGAGDDTINGGAGSDYLNGGADFDIVSFSFDPTYGAFNNLQRSEWFATPWTGVSVNLASGFATDMAGNVDTIALGTIEGVTGTFLADILVGDAGNNTFYGLSGNDYIDGGDGSDTVTYGDWGNRSGSGAPDLVGMNASRPNGVTVTLVAAAPGTASDSEGGTDTLVSVENVIGSTGNDTINGSTVANTLSGGAGLDQLNGGGGADTLNGDAGNDTLDGGVGNDYMVGGLGDDTYVIESNLDGIVEAFGEGTDTVRSTSAFSQLDAGLTLENLTYIGSSTSTLYGNSLGNILTGGALSDNLNGFFGADTLNGGDGNDFLYADNTDVVNGGAGSDAVYIQSTTGTSVNLGMAQVEFVVGFSGNDTLDGSTATVAVTLLGGAGADVLKGGSANDFIYMDAADTSVDAGGGTNDVVVISDTAGATLNVAAANAEYVIGGGGADVLDATGSVNAVVIQGGAGADTIAGGNANDYFYGNGGVDVFKVTSNAQFDAIFDFVDTGGAEDDRIDVRGLGANFDTLAEVLAATTDYSGTSLIDFGGGNLLYVFQIAKTSLDADDFIFV